MSLYRVTSNPTVCNGDESAWFNLGDIVEPLLGEVRPDGDGDIQAYNLSQDPERDDWHYIALGCLTKGVGAPVAPRNDVERVSVRALRAALSLGEASGKDIDDLVRVVQVIDAAYLA